MRSGLVIGAGHDGLIAAIHLASHGLDVTVLEHAPAPGGATSTSELTLPGFLHDHCAAFVPMSAASPGWSAVSLAAGLRAGLPEWTRRLLRSVGALGLDRTTSERPRRARTLLSVWS